MPHKVATIAALAKTNSGPTAPEPGAADAACYEEAVHYVRIDSPSGSQGSKKLHRAISSSGRRHKRESSIGVSSAPSAVSSSGTSSSQTHPIGGLLRPRSRSAVPAPPSIDDTRTETTTSSTSTTTGSGSATSSVRSSKRHRAKMAARAVSKPLRRSYVGVVAGLASTIGFGQAMYLKATYQSPPDARGPRSGVERANDGSMAAAGETGALTRAEGHVSRVLPPATTAIPPSPITPPQGVSAAAGAVAAAGAPPAASASTDELGRAAVAAAADRAAGLGDSATPADLAAAAGEPLMAASSARSGANGIATRDSTTTGAAAAAAQRAARSKRILIVGDSLVSGVGGESSFDDGPSDGPALPRQVARYLSELLHVDVQWNAMSVTGGDVRLLRRKIVPMLSREKQRGTIGDISAVVVVTGVNDWKRFSPFRTASKFREDLLDFINGIREQLGSDCKIFLPAIPGVRYTPRFHEPLRSIVTFLNDLWDSQKLQLSRSVPNVFFVGQPPTHEWGSDPQQYFSILDRVHPSELGYQRWAKRIAVHMTSAFGRSIIHISQQSPLKTVIGTDTNGVSSNSNGQTLSQTTAAASTEKTESSSNSAKVAT